MSISVLVAEDDPGDQRVVRKYLESLGYAVTAIAATGPEALRAVEAHRPDVALVNAQLGGDGAGLQTAEELHDRFGVPVVLTSVSGAWNPADRARSVGAHGHVVKPFLQQQLSSAIEMAYARHRMERALESQRRWFHAVLSGLSEGVIACDADGRITFLNRAAATLLDVEPATAVEQPIREVFRPLPDPAGAAPEDPITAALRGNGPVPNRVARVQVGDQVRLLESSGTVIDEASGAGGAVMVFRDVSQRERTAEAMRLAAKMEAVGALASGIAHHFNNDLQIVLGHAELITGLAPAGGQIHNSAREILRAGEGTTKLVEQLFTFSTAGHDASERVSLPALVDQLCTLIRTVVPATVTVELPKHVPDCEMRVRTRDVQSAVLHLVENALVAMPRGGTLTFGVARREPSGAVALSIRDTGGGLAPDVQKRLFDPYVSSQGQSHSAGLGLASVLHSAQLHGGTVEVQTERSRGTTLSIVLPAGGAAVPLPATLPGSRTS